MRRNWRFILVLLTASASIACHAGQPELMPFEGRIGVYHFSERVPSTRGSETIMFEGEFTVLGDTVMIAATPGPCRYDQHSTKSGGITYRCGDVAVHFDRRNPVEKAFYSVAVIVSEPQRNCPAGRRNCSTMDLVERSVIKTGQLKPSPVR